MRSLIFFFISILIFLILVLAVSFILPSRVMVTRSVIINAPKEKVAAQVGQFANWYNWYPALQDKSVSMIEKSSNEVLLKDSSGRQIAMKMNKLSVDTINVSFESISSSTIDYQFVTEQKADSTRVSLNVFTKFKWYPWQKLKGVVLDKITGPMYEETLRNLKKAVEETR